MKSPLEGVKVVDVSRYLAGPYCTMMLGDMGAEVIKIERPGSGDESRQFAPFWNGESCFFLSVNRNKKSLTLDIKKPAGREIFLELVRGADVLVENFRPGVTRKLGIDYATLARENPRLIYCSMTGYGSVGPAKDRPAFDLLVQADAGLMSITGIPDGPPVKTGTSVLDLACGTNAVAGILAALLMRERTGRGQLIETSLFEAQIAWLNYHAVGYFATGRVPSRLGSAHPSVAPYQAFKTQDGYLVVAIGHDRAWATFCSALQRTDLVEDQRFRTNPLRVQNREALVEELESTLTTRTTAEWLDILTPLGIPCAPINTVDRVLSSRQAADLGMVPSLPHPKVPDLKVCGFPIHMSEGTEPTWSPPPLLGQHTEEILASLGKTPAEIARLRREGVI